MKRRTRRALAALTPLLAAFLASQPALAQTMDDALYSFVGLDELEMAPASDERRAGYDGRAWIGGDVQRLHARLQGEHATRGGAGEVEARLLYGRAVHPFWELQGGVRVDGLYGGADDRARGSLALGVEGLAPHWFEIEGFLFVSGAGDVSARLEASYDLLFTQRLVLEPALEVDLAVQEVPAWGVGSGLDGVELGARLRYEIVRELAPYVGASWTRRFGGAADLAVAAGEARGGGALVAGLRVWR